MSEQEYFVKYVIIAATLGERHALSLIDELKTQLKAKGEEFLNIDSSEEWSVIDLGDILIHLLTPEHRGIYNIEELLENLKKGRFKRLNLISLLIFRDYQYIL